MTTSTLTPRQTFREAVAQVAAKAHAKLPECSGRIASAVKLVLLGEVTLHADGTATVGSCTDPTKTYTVNGMCTCKDFERAPGQLCKHRLAYGSARRAQELLPPAPAPEPEAPVAATVAQTPGHSQGPLPEAPASVNCHILIEGRQVQVTLRDTDETRLLERLAAVLRQYPDLPSQTGKKAIKNAGETPDKGWCQMHHCAMTLNEKDGRSWWSHKTVDGWCKGRQR